jgi:hypothetical protein
MKEKVFVFFWKGVNLLKQLNCLVGLATIGVFICTIIATIYAVRVSRRTIESILKDSRPWVGQKTIDTALVKNRMTMEIVIYNSGKLPAFIQATTNIRVDEMIYEDNSDEITAVIMPGQELKIPCYLSGNFYKAVLLKQKKLTIDSLINYSDDKDTLEKYYNKVTWEFKPPEYRLSGDQKIPVENTAQWKIISGNFK